VVVRLNAGTEAVETPVVVAMAPASGEPFSVQLKDDGQPPDVTYGDGIWSGVTWVMGTDFTVSVSLGTTQLEAGTISWGKDAGQRDLNLTLHKGTIKADAGAAPPMQGPGVPPDPSGADQPIQQPSSGPPTSEGNINNPLMQSSEDATLYVVFGVSALAAGLLAYLWFRGGAVKERALPKGMVMVPEPGLLGPGVPSLSDGLSIWVVAPSEARELLRVLLATLARYHRVLVRTPTRGSVPAVHGGPVFQLEGSSPQAVGEAVDAFVEQGQGVAILILGEDLDERAIKAFNYALPERTGGIVLMLEAPKLTLPMVRCKRQGDRWHFNSGVTEVVARESAFGLELV
jgi:hypothetical protein